LKFKKKIKFFSHENAASIFKSLKKKIILFFQLTRPVFLKAFLKNNLFLFFQVWIDCRGEYPADEEAIGKLKYYPESRGIPNHFFPYLNQPGYQSPVVAVQFANAKENQLLHIECRAWAKNIGYNRRDRIGINHLEVNILTEVAAQTLKDSS
jgi:hypothetical protein